jgi:cytochrome P450 family 135
MARECTLAFMQEALPPGPSEPRLAQMMQWLSRPVAYAERQRDRYGEAFTARIEPRPWVMLGDPEDVRTVFTAGPQRVNAGEANGILRPTLGSHSLLLLDGDEHMRQRKLMLPAFHGERVERYREIMREATERAVTAWSGGEPFALRPHTQAITLEVIMRAVFGLEEEAAVAPLREPLRRMLDWAGNPAALLVIAMVGADHPFVRRVLARRYVEPVDRELYALIAARRAAPDLAERDDILSMLLLTREPSTGFAGGARGQPMSDVELRDELLTLLLAGHETTATSLAWAVERLVRHPGGLERLAHDRDYADAVVKEVLRLRPVVAIVLRRLREPLEIAGRELPAGTTVAPCILLVHRREDVYPDPEAFRPERFLDRPPGTYTWIPFGGGVRRCLGAAFAQMEMQVVLQTLAQSVRLEAVGGAEGVRRRGVTLVPARGGEVRATALAAR